MARRLGERTVGVRVDMTPMVDVMMLLVIFFMMTTAFVTVYPGFDINLPQASMESREKKQMDVVVAKDGRIAVDGLQVDKGELSSRLCANGSPPDSVCVRADKEATHGMVVAIMDEIHKAGVTKLAIAVEERGR
ncbi:MAG: exbD 3 [Firmicutes bacterium]|nr:exbD 3 [Bacillota bacterium]